MVHNEVVIDTRSIEAYLPEAILGFFHLGDAAGENAQSQLEHVQSVRKRFLETYQLGEERAPLLRLDLHAERPFSLG